MQERILSILHQYWGYQNFRPLQEDIICSVLNGRDTLALLPTGGGKSICFQVPALAMGGLCLVVTPLVALMKDQVENLRKRGIKAAAIYSGMHYNEIDSVIHNAVHDKTLTFLYLSPERLKTDLFRLNLPKMNVSLIAVDEAHCISQWGYDFRPPYLQIADIRPYFPKVPVLALTATATPEVVKDIQEKLYFRQKNVFQKSFKRDHLIYYVVQEEDKQNRLLRIMQRYSGSGIVYVRSRKRTREIAFFLQKHHIEAEYYHAGLDSATRDVRQKQWMKGEMRVIVSTNAFGMGIDKPDVRFVVHMDIPDSLEAYFQEAGRGGRDEKDSVAIMLYDGHDLQELRENLDLSYPPLDMIRKVYHMLADFYRIEMGTGADTVFPFDIEGFITASNMKPLLIFNAISFLEKEGLLRLSEEAKDYSRLRVKLSSSGFDRFYKEYPHYEELLKLILRLYNGLFADEVKINESGIATKWGKKKEDVIEALKKMAQLDVLEYIPGSDKPLLHFLENRVPGNHLNFSPSVYEERKMAAEKRVEAVEQYVKNNGRCRSQMLLSYFGERKSEPCGQCDVCLRHRNEKITKAEYNKIASAIMEKLISDSYTVRELVFLLSDQYPEEKVVRILRNLIDEGKVPPPQ